nr:transposase [Nostoc sp. NZL]
MEDLSHDSVNRFLLREQYEPKDLFDEVKLYINLVGGTKSYDDTVIDKPHSDPKLTELIGYVYSGRHHGKNFTQVQNLEIPENGLIVHLKKFGQVKVFRRSFKNETHRYYIMFLPDKDALFLISLTELNKLHSIHWGIECYHRAIKQVCGIELFMVRTSEAIKTHFFSAIRAFTQLELMRTEELIQNWYEVQRNLSLQVARDFILEHLEQKMGLNTHSQTPVNA